jgi:hypothetical protein
MATVFAAVTKQLLTPGASSFTPKAFLGALRRLWWAMQDEYQQHDAQELMSWLLDAVHEDLNRIKIRSNVTFEEKEDEPDHFAARRWWEHHALNNDSEFVNLFQGLYKSIVDCKACGKRSIKFDPFMYLTLSLPEERVQIIVLSTSLSGQRTVHPPQSYAKDAKFDEVRKRIGFEFGTVTGATDDGCVIKGVYKAENRVSSAADGTNVIELFAFELEPERAYLAVQHQVGDSTAKFGTPLVLSVPAGEYRRAELYRVVVDKLK